jgi:hypothetical protein
MNDRASYRPAGSDSSEDLFCFLPSLVGGKSMDDCGVGPWGVYS